MSKDEWMRRYAVACGRLAALPDLRQIIEEAPDVWAAAVVDDISPEEAARLQAEQARLLGGG